MKKTDDPIIIEQVFTISKDILWKVITKQEHMIQWFFENISEFKAEIGFQTQFTIENEGRVFPHHWKIIEVIPFEKITYNWKYEGYKGDSNVSFELIDENGGTKLVLTTIILEDFQENIPEFTREACIGGWEYFIQNQLKSYLENE
jgi:uncharacterized protein YndB with AHSA1/START domain